MRVLFEFTGQELERDMPSKTAVFGLVHDAHSAGAQLPDDGVVENALPDQGFQDCVLYLDCICDDQAASRRAAREQNLRFQQVTPQQQLSVGRMATTWDVTIPKSEDKAVLCEDGLAVCEAVIVWLRIPG